MAKRRISLATAEEVSQLSESIANISDELHEYQESGLIKNSWEWSLGALDSGKPNTQGYRCHANEIQFSQNPVIIKVISKNTPYKFAVSFYSQNDENTYTTWSGWQTGEYTISKGTYYRVYMAKVTEDYNPNNFNITDASSCIFLKIEQNGNGIENHRWMPVELDFSLYPNKRFKGEPPNGYISWADESSINFCATRIEVKQGEKYRLRGQHYYQAQCYAVTDATDKVIMRESGSGSVYDVFAEIEIPSNAKWLYVSGYNLRYVQKWGEVDTDLSVLHDKKIAYNGDSICATHINNNTLRMNGGGFAKLISDATGCDFTNNAVDGSIVRAKEGSGTNYHSVSDSIVEMPTDADIYCFEGGINDYWTRAPLGTYSKSDYTSEVDRTTFCGALEYIFRYALEHFLGKAICYVIVHKVTTTAYTQNSMGNTFEDYHNAIVGICEKYGIPYYDAWLESGLNGWNTYQNNAFLTANSDGTGDGTHPNKDGYLKYYVPQLISLFEKLVL